jgi:hypothetical protein
VRRALPVGVLGIVVLAGCMMMPAPPVPHDNLYYTEVHVDAAAVSGSYTLATTCTLEPGGSSTHTDTLTHVAGTETVKTFTWPEPDPVDCTMTETAGPPMTTPSYWILGTETGGFFGTPPIFVPLTDPTPAPQTCHESIIGTYKNVTPNIDVWNCIFTVQNKP